MKASDLLKNISYDIVKGENLDFEVSDLGFDSRSVSPGSCFVAIVGEATDGHHYLNDVIQHGAKLIVLQNEVELPFNEGDFTVVQVKDSRSALAQMASNYYESPTSKLSVIGVTGTNGKTTVCYLLEYLLNRLGVSTGIMGTIDHHFDGESASVGLTTPDPLTLQMRLSQWQKKGAQAVAMEVSSHALVQSRVEAMHFDIGVFTNLSRDHLDYHKTMEEYFKAKDLLFSRDLEKSQKSKKSVVLNMEDPCAMKFSIPDTAKVYFYGSSHCVDFEQLKTFGDQVDALAYENLDVSFKGLKFNLLTVNSSVEVEVPLIGAHNAENVLASLSVIQAMGLDVQKAAGHLSEFPGVPGRLQSLIGENRYIFIDYAHTDAALENVLQSLSYIKRQSSEDLKIKTIFGCGGDRDKGKRPLMLKAALKYSDEVMITSDNPRTEDPTQIIMDIQKGILIPEDVKVFENVDRKYAIENMILNSKPNDVILIAGKGHEDYQVIGTEKRPFSDFEVALKALEQL